MFDQKSGKFLESAHQEDFKTVIDILFRYRIYWGIQGWRAILNFIRKTCVWPWITQLKLHQIKLVGVVSKSSQRVESKLSLGFIFGQDLTEKMTK